jgi:DNA recombination protein RmuC
LAVSLAFVLVFDERCQNIYNQSSFVRDKNMEWVIVAIAGALILLILGLLVWLILANAAGRREVAGQAAGIGLLQQQLEALKAAQDGTKDALQKSLQAGQATLSQNLQSSQQTLGRLNSQIGELQGTNKQMLQIGAEVRRLQDILSSPKLRGQMGEWSLKSLLENILPQNSYKLQFPFKDGKIVDAFVYLADYSVPVDAKFPLPGFEAIVKAESDEQKTRLRKQFLKDVTVHIDKIASDYIRPAEGTLDFALMYIPAENIYYETIVKYAGDTQDILQYSLDRKVIPVSPNLLYAYLMTVVMGLHGLQIEKQAAEIRQNLKKLNADFADFISNWDTLGGHIRNTANKYDEAGKKLDRFGLQLGRIQGENEEKQQIAQEPNNRIIGDNK